MVKDLKELRSLDLWFPSCCGIEKFALSGTYPHLRSFSMSSIFLANTSPLDPEGPTTTTFLSRHPALQQLHLRYFDDGWPYCKSDARMELKPGDVPSLRALSVDRMTLDAHDDSFVAALAASPLEALDFECHRVPDPTWPLAPCTGALKYLSLSGTHRSSWSTDYHYVMLPNPNLLYISEEEQARIQKAQEEYASRRETSVNKPEQLEADDSSDKPSASGGGLNTEDGQDAVNGAVRAVRAETSPKGDGFEDPKVRLAAFLATAPSLREFRMEITSHRGNRLSVIDLVRWCLLTQNRHRR